MSGCCSLFIIFHCDFIVLFASLSVGLCNIGCIPVCLPTKANLFAKIVHNKRFGLLSDSILTICHCILICSAYVPSRVIVNVLVSLCVSVCCKLALQCIGGSPC